MTQGLFVIISNVVLEQEWVNVRMFLFSLSEWKTMLRTVSCAAARSWTLTLTNGKRIWIHTLSRSQQLVLITVLSMLTEGEWQQWCHKNGPSVTHQPPPFFWEVGGRQARSLQHSDEGGAVCLCKVSEGGEKYKGMWEEVKMREERQRERERKEGMREGVRHAASHAGLIWKTMSAAAATGERGWILFCIEDTISQTRNLCSHSYRRCKSSGGTRGLRNKASLQVCVRHPSAVTFRD